MAAGCRYPGSFVRPVDHGTQEGEKKHVAGAQCLLFINKSNRFPGSKPILWCCFVSFPWFREASGLSVWNSISAEGWTLAGWAWVVGDWITLWPGLLVQCRIWVGPEAKRHVHLLLDMFPDHVITSIYKEGHKSQRKSLNPSDLYHPFRIQQFFPPFVPTP
jgi:hypothetical protein